MYLFPVLPLSLVHCDFGMPQFSGNESSASCIVKRVSWALASLYKEYVVFPSGNKLQEIQRGFMNHSGISGVVGAIDCKYVPIQLPGGGRAEIFQNRKGCSSNL